MKIGIIVGTRPEIIKMAPVIRECQRRTIDFFLIHSNQHYSADMDSIFFQELSLPSPKYNLGVGSGQHGNQTGNILIKIEPILLKEQPTLVLVQGDTNTVLAGALAARKLDIKLGHIEAGLRSYDRMMPEETNRTLTDHMSDYLFAVSSHQESILLGEGIARAKIHVVGNTISDSLMQHIKIASKQSRVLETLGLEKARYFLVTAHRTSNVDFKSHLLELFQLFDALHEKYNERIIWPMHPRTQSKLTQFKISVPNYINVISPVGYLDFLQLQKNARLVLTDSGGIQEEACILGVPCITLRENTERPESVNVGANFLVGRSAEKALEAAHHWLSRDEFSWSNPFGDGHVAEEILDIVCKSSDYSRTHDIIAREQSIAVIGMGYMGLPIACLLADQGYSILGVDNNNDKVTRINQGQCPFGEIGLPQLMSRAVNQGFLRASTQVQSSDIYLIAVPTPQQGKSCDLTHVNAAVDAVAQVASDGQTIILESTVAPGTCLAIESMLRELGLFLNIVHCPERAIPGKTLHELVSNDRIIGANNPNTQQQVKAIYQTFVTGKIHLTDATTAECVKLVENTSRDIGIAFANELSEICEEIGVDVFEVIGLANHHPRVNILSPGPGVGGHCIPIDPWFLVQNTTAGHLVRLARTINDQRPIVVAKAAIRLAEMHVGTRIGILGVAYKANVDDCRETPAKPIVEYLQGANFTVKYHDPFVESWCCERVQEIGDLLDWAEVLVLVTDHDCYRGLETERPTIDTRRTLRRDPLRAN